MATTNRNSARTRAENPAVLKLISGGQTGADRAALDYAVLVGISYGGWCPKGRRAEDGKLPPKYRLRETSSPAYSQRTRRNVLNADATVILSKRPLVGGTALTAQICGRHGKPCLVLSPALPLAVAARRLRQFLRENRVRVLNVAGPRASSDSSVYEFTYRLLGRVLRTGRL